MESRSSITQKNRNGKWGLFNVYSVDNRKISLKTGAFLVDNYVDDVDRTVYMHKTTENNYAHVYMTLSRSIVRILHALLEGTS